MAGYYETYLNGLMQMRRMEQMDRNDRMRQLQYGRQLQAMQMQEFARLQNQQRLQAVLQEQMAHNRNQESVQVQNLLARLQAQMQPHYGTVMEGQDAEGNPKQYLVDSKSGRLFDPSTNSVVQNPGAIRKSAAMPIAERNRLQGLGTNLQEIVALAKGFKPEYTNALGPQVGQAENIARQYLPGMDAAMPNWWRAQRRLDEIPERHKILGAAMTRHELPLWAQGSINPGMRPADIIRMLNLRAGILRSATERNVASLTPRYNKKEIEQLIGMPVGQSANRLMSDEELVRYGAEITGLHDRPPLEDILGR